MKKVKRRVRVVNESVENAIEEIIQNFKFELVYAYMKMVGWTYRNAPDTPTVNTLEETARGLLEDVKKEHGSRLLTGGFEASYYVEECYGPTLALKFIPLQTEAHL